MHAPKNGFFYVIDRTNGEFISAQNHVPVTWTTGIDRAATLAATAGESDEREYRHPSSNTHRSTSHPVDSASNRKRAS